jgi:dTDP-4-amino-4,6-dideoxygalactose transaminase
MIPVTKPFLPPKEDVYNLLDGVWQRQWLTNNGPLVNELEEKLKEYLDVHKRTHNKTETESLPVEDEDQVIQDAADAAGALM